MSSGAQSSRFREPSSSRSPPETCARRSSVAQRNVIGPVADSAAASSSAIGVRRRDPVASAPPDRRTNDRVPSIRACAVRLAIVTCDRPRSPSVEQRGQLRWSSSAVPGRCAARRRVVPDGADARLGPRVERGDERRHVARSARHGVRFEDGQREEREQVRLAAVMDVAEARLRVRGRLPILGRTSDPNFSYMLRRCAGFMSLKRARRSADAEHAGWTCVETGLVGSPRPPSTPPAAPNGSA